MNPNDDTPKPTRLARRRVAWGSLLADAPWDGRPRAVAPIAIPATAAGRVSTPDFGGDGLDPTPRRPKRLPFGALLASAPWAARPTFAAPAVAPELGRLAATV